MRRRWSSARSYSSPPSEGAEEAVDLAGKNNFDGKVLTDITNALDFKGGSAGIFVGTTDSLGERIQRKLPKAKVVKCFNTVGIHRWSTRSTGTSRFSYAATMTPRRRR